MSCQPGVLDQAVELTAFVANGHPVHPRGDLTRPNKSLVTLRLARHVHQADNRGGSSAQRRDVRVGTARLDWTPASPLGGNATRTLLSLARPTHPVERRFLAVTPCRCVDRCSKLHVTPSR